VPRSRPRGAEQGETHPATITYDRSDKVLDIKTKKVASTL